LEEKMKRRILLFALVMLMAAGVLFATGGRQTAQTDPNSFTLLVDADRPASPGWYGLYDVIERETGVKVNLLIYPYQAAVEQKNIRLSTGDYPEAMGGWIVGTNDIVSLAADRVLLPLQDLIMNTTNVRAALEVPGVRAAMTFTDGNIYSPPYLVQEPLVSFLPFINQTWLDQLGLRMPTTPEEFKQVLIAFRDRIPNVNNQRIIPFSADPNNFDIGIFAGWWGVNGAGLGSGAGMNAGGFAVINGRIENTLTRPEVRAAITYFADLYREGLIDRELFTQDKATWEAKGKLGLYGSCYGYGSGDWIPEVTAAQRESDPSRNWGGWAPLPVLRAPGVTNPVWRNNRNGNTIFRTQFVITDKAQGAKAATIMKWLDATYDPIHSLEQNAGTVNRMWRILSQTPTQTIWQGIDTSSWAEEDRQKAGWSGWSVASLPRFQRPTPGWREQPRPGWENEYREKDVADALYKPFLESVVMPEGWLNQADARRATDIQTAISQYVSQKIAEWVSGNASIDAEWDAYVAQLNRLGLQDLITIKRNSARL
jgi:putative aldouronate transport system substrate-binding protein